MASIATNRYSKNYTNTTQSLSGTCGIPDSALNGVSSKYIVTITATGGIAILKQNGGGALAGAIGALGGTIGNLFGGAAASSLSNSTTGGGRNEFTVYAFLQDKVSLVASSKWQGVTQSLPGDANVDKWSGIAEFAAQSTLGRTKNTPLTTRRMWAGSDPISLRMKLKFESFSNPYREVLLPCIGLQSLTLPRGGGPTNTFGLIPPGPSPFDLSLKGESQNERTENIELNIGGFLDFWSVIVKDVTISFENRMSDSGPIGAEVDLTIETYQMLTREDLMKVANATGLVQGVLGQGGSITGAGT